MGKKLIICLIFMLGVFPTVVNAEASKVSSSVQNYDSVASLKFVNSLKDENILDADYDYLSGTTYIDMKKVETSEYCYILTHVVVRDPSQIRGGLSSDVFGGAREKATDFGKKKDAVLVTNGSYFSYDTGLPVAAGMFIKNGEIVVGGVSNGDEICLTKDGILFTPRNHETAEQLVSMGVKEVWGTADPLLIQDGVTYRTDLQGIQGRYNRTAIGMVRPCEYYIITAGEGDYRRGLTYDEMQSIFLELGCTYARSLDGGGSATLSYEGNMMNTPAQYDERPVVDFIYFTDYTDEKPISEIISLNFSGKNSLSINNYSDIGVDTVSIREAGATPWSRNTLNSSVLLNYGNALYDIMLADGTEAHTLYNIPALDISELSFDIVDDEGEYEYIDPDTEEDVVVHGDFSRKVRKVKATTDVNIRKTPSTDLSPLATVSVGEELEVVAESETWCMIEWNGSYSYVNKEYIEG